MLICFSQTIAVLAFKGQQFIFWQRSINILDYRAFIYEILRHPGLGDRHRDARLGGATGAAPIDLAFHHRLLLFGIIHQLQLSYLLLILLQSRPNFHKISSQKPNEFDTFCLQSPLKRSNMDFKEVCIYVKSQ